MLNHLLIEQRLVLIAGYLAELEKLSRVAREEFLAEKLMTAAAESYLRRSLEAIFDIGRHVLAKTGAVNLATEYKAIAKGLVKQGFVDDKLGDRLLEMAGYRNRLVHMYSEVSDEELYSILLDDLDDIRSFVRQIRRFIAQHRPS